VIEKTLAVVEQTDNRQEIKEIVEVLTITFCQKIEPIFFCFKSIFFFFYSNMLLILFIYQNLSKTQNQ